MRAPRTIFDPRFSAELNAYVHTMMNTVSIKYNLPYAELVKLAFAADESSCESDNEDTVELELVCIHNQKYLYDLANRKVYTYDKNRMLIGMLDETLNIVPFKPLAS